MSPSENLLNESESLPAMKAQSQLPGKHDFSFKITTLGDSGVGKTCLSLRYTTDAFSVVTPSTCGIDYSWRTIRLGGKVIAIRVWDTGGQERFRSIIKQYPRNSDGVILAYDVTEPKSFHEIPSWLEYAKLNGAEEAITILVGCKSDLGNERKISSRHGEELARSLGLFFIETSAKEAENVETAFRTLALQILERKMRETQLPPAQNSSPQQRIRVHVRTSSRKKRWWTCGLF